MPVLTGQALITGALTDLGMCEQGGVANVSDSNAALIELNNQWDSWGIDEGLIFGVQQSGVGLTQSVAAVTIGVGTPYAFIPSRVYDAYFLNVALAMRVKLDIVSREQYYNHRDLAASALCPDELYIDWNAILNGANSNITMYTYPVSNQAGSQILLVYGATFSAWTLNGNYAVPEGYPDALRKALAFRLLSQFGAAVQAQVAQVVTMLGEKAEARIREMNRINRLLPPGSERAPGMPPPQPGGKAA